MLILPCALYVFGTQLLYAQDAPGIARSAGGEVRSFPGTVRDPALNPPVGEFPRAMSAWFAISVILVFGAIAAPLVYLYRAETRLRSDLRRLRTGLRQLETGRKRVTLEGLHFLEVRECADELTRVAEELYRQRGRLSEDATHDVLTKLPNRRALIRAMTNEVSSALRAGWPLSVIMVDLDHFKQLNDTYGHQAGDDVLQQTAARLRGLVRESDLLARYGGEEFAIVLPRADLTRSVEIAEQLRNALRCTPVAVREDLSVQVSGSFGVAELHACGATDPESLIRLADEALYEAKGRGRDTVAVAPIREAQTSSQGGSRGQGEDCDRSRSDRREIDADTLSLMGSTFSIMQVLPDKARAAMDTLQQLAIILGSRRAVYFLDDADCGLWPVAWVGVPEYDQEAHLTPSADLVQWFARHRATGEFSGSRSVDAACVVVERSGEGPVVRIPLSLQGTALGVVEAYEVAPGFTLTQRQNRLITAICLIGASAVRFCDQYLSAQDRWTGLIEILCGVLQSNDPYKRDHALRVSHLAMQLAQALGQTEEEELRLIRVAGLLHDIGNVHIPDQIRLKKGQLRESERRIIQEHTRAGAEMLRNLDSIAGLDRVVLHHHEHYDGGGYPDGLIGDEIPFESRILAVAEAFVAMTSDRPYRKAMSTGEALSRIHVASGTQFDPMIVEVLWEVVTGSEEKEADPSRPTGALPSRSHRKALAG